MVLAHSCQFTRGTFLYFYCRLLQVMIIIIIVIIVIIKTVLIDWSDALAFMLQGHFAQSQ